MPPVVSDADQVRARRTPNRTVRIRVCQWWGVGSPGPRLEPGTAPDGALCSSADRPGSPGSHAVLAGTSALPEVVPGAFPPKRVIPPTRPGNERVPRPAGYPPYRPPLPAFRWTSPPYSPNVPPFRPVYPLVRRVSRGISMSCEISVASARVRGPSGFRSSRSPHSLTKKSVVARYAGSQPHTEHSVAAESCSPPQSGHCFLL